MSTMYNIDDIYVCTYITMKNVKRWTLYIGDSVSVTRCALTRRETASLYVRM